MADETFGASFTIDVTQLKAGLNTANKLIRESQTQFQKAAAGLQDWTKNETALTAKINSLNRIIPVQAEKVRALKEQYQKLVDEGLDETSDRAIQLRTQINREEAALESNRAEVKRQTEALQELRVQNVVAGDAIEETGDKAEKTSGAFTVMKGALANLVADGFRAAINAAKEFTRELVNVGITFDDSMAQVAAVSGATAEELEQLRAKAKELGESTKFTASEAADAFNYMAMAGWKTEDMLGGIEGILNLAAASGADLATTSDIVTDALTAMGYKAKDAGRLADVMAAASSNANTNVELMGLTFQYAAPLVGALGYSMEDTAKAIGLMANAGVKGEKAGTALRSILTRLANPPKDCANSLEELGVSLTKSSGEMKTFDEVMQNLRVAFADLDEVEKATHASHIAGQEALSGMLAIVNAAPADYEKLTQAIENSDGAAQHMADTMLDTLGGDMTVLNSQLEGVRLTIYEKLSPTLRDLVKDAQKWLSSVDWDGFGKKAGDALKKIIEYGKTFAKNVLPTIKAGLKVVGSALKFVIDNFSWLSKTVLIAVTAFKAFKAVMAVTTAINAAKVAVAGLTAGVSLATKAQTAWNAVMAANPIGAVITAVALLAGGIALLVGSEKEAEKTETEWEKSLNNTRDAIQENADAWGELMTAQQEAVNSGMSQMSYYESLWNELHAITDENGKIQEGYEKRASFIVDTLKEALGIEIEVVNGQIQKYDELVSKIDEVINKKKAQILLDAQTPAYEEAIKKVNDAYSERIRLSSEMADFEERAKTADAERIELFNKAVAAMEKGDQATYNYYQNLAVQREIDAGKLYDALEKSRAAYEENEGLVEKYTYNIAQYEKNMALAHEGAWEQMSTSDWEYVKNFENVGEARRAELDEQIRIEEEKLAYMKDAQSKSNSDIYSEQISASEKRLEALRGNLEQYVQTTETELAKDKVVWSNSLADNLSEITRRKIEFKDAGEGLVQMFVDGEKLGAPKSKEEMAKLATDAVNEITKKEKDAETAGKNLIDGINNGISNEDKQNGVFSKIASFGSRLLARFKASLEEQSPSKATRKMGRYLLDGLSLGIGDEESGVIKKISRFGKNVVRSLQSQVNAINGDYGFGNITPNIQAGMNAQSGGGVNNSRTVTVNQYNTYSQAHSRYEIYKSKQQTAAAVRLALGSVQ